MTRAACDAGTRLRTSTRRRASGPRHSGRLRRRSPRQSPRRCHARPTCAVRGRIVLREAPRGDRSCGPCRWPRASRDLQGVERDERCSHCMTNGIHHELLAVEHANLDVHSYSIARIDDECVGSFRIADRHTATATTGSSGAALPSDAQQPGRGRGQVERRRLGRARIDERARVGAVLRVVVADVRERATNLGRRAQ